MENLIIKNLLEQIERLTEENNRLKQNVIINENNIIINENNIIKEIPDNRYMSIEEMIQEKYTSSLNIDDFELLLKIKIVENDIFDCLYKNIKDVIINVLTRELSNKEQRPLHKNKYFIVKIGDEWIKKEYFDFDKIIKRLINIITHTILSKLYLLKKSSNYIDAGAGIHTYKHHRFDYDDLKLKILEDVNHQAISKIIGDKLHINLNK